MIDAELEKVIGKALKLKELHRARARVLQLERELRGEPTKPEEPITFSSSASIMAKALLPGGEAYGRGTGRGSRLFGERPPAQTG